MEVGGHCWQDQGSKDLINARYEYYATRRNHATLEHHSARIDAGIMQRAGGADAEIGKVGTVLIGLSHPPETFAYFHARSGLLRRFLTLADSYDAGFVANSACEWGFSLDGCDNPISMVGTCPGMGAY